MSLPNTSFEGYVPRTDQNIVTSTIYNLRVTIEGREGKKGKKNRFTSYRSAAYFFQIQIA